MINGKEATAGASEDLNDERLSEASAIRTADNMRGIMENPHSNSWMEPPTAEDYESACKTIEELEKLAEEEPGTEKVLMTLARLAQGTGRGAVLLFMGICENVLSFPPRRPDDPGGLASLKMRDEFAKTKTKFWDAARRLREVEKAGENYRETEETIDEFHKKYGVK